MTPDKEEVQGEDKMGEEDSEIRGGEYSETEGMSGMCCQVYVTFIGNASALRCGYSYND